MTNPREAITRECDAIKEMLLAKNAAYGDSALDPVRVFSRASSEEQLLVRIDDKLSRISRGVAGDEDVILDLIGYLVLLRVARAVQKEEDDWHGDHTCGPDCPYPDPCTPEARARIRATKWEDLPLQETPPVPDPTKPRP